MVLSKFNPIILIRDLNFDVKLKEYAILNSFGWLSDNYVVNAVKGKIELSGQKGACKKKMVPQNS